MDYTDLASVKNAMDSTKSTDDAELSVIITAVSRALDRKCTGATDSDNYFMIEAVTDELIRGQVANGGSVLCHPHKPKVTSIEAISYRFYPQNDWVSIDPTYAVADHRGIKIFSSFSLRSEIFLKVSYTGGLFNSTGPVIPADFKEAATVLAVRYYKEVKSGLGDTIGVAELGQLVYTKAWPQRVLDLIAPYRRVVPWT